MPQGRTSQKPVALVTGAAGFIGSHLVERLLAENWRVRGFVRYTSRGALGALAYVPAHPELDLISGDLRDAEAVQTAVQGCQTVFHLGAQISIPYSQRHPAETLETNLLGTLHVLQAARAAGIQRLVQMSSSEVYGTAQTRAIAEDHPQRAQSPYAASKIGADQLAHSFHLSYGLPVTILRPFNTYGPRQSDRAVIPAIIAQALTQPVVHLGALHPTRDLTYVSDTVAGLLAAAQSEAAIGQDINLGVGQEISIGDLAARIIALLGRSVTIEADPQRFRPGQSEVLRLLSDNRRAQTLLGWQPAISLEEGLRHTIDWVASHLADYHPQRYRI